MKSLSAFLASVEIIRRANPEWRYGQALFNVLYQFEPELADRVRGSDLDPFYVDSRAGVFLDWLSGEIE